MGDELSEDGCGKERKCTGRQIIGIFTSLLTPARE
jgi:hypothetical protein